MEWINTGINYYINTWCNDGYVDEYDDIWSSGGNGSSLADIESSGVGSYCNNEYAGGLLAGADGIDTISINEVL